MNLLLQLKTSTIYKVILSFLFILFSTTSSFAGEIDSIMSGVGTIIVLVLFFILAGILSPIFVFIKKAKPRFIVFTIINLAIFLMIWFTSDPNDYFIIDRSYIFQLQIGLQIIGSVWMLFIYLGEEKIKVDEEILDEEI